MTTYKVIPQVDFDKSVQRIIVLGLNRIASENIVLAFWKASQDLDLNFKTLIDNAVALKSLDVEQPILDHINLNLPSTTQYHKRVARAISPIVQREL